MRTTVTYQAPAQLFRSDSLFQKDYKDCLHIVATNSLKQGIGQSLRDNRWIDSPVIQFSELFKKIAGDGWSGAKAQLKQFLTLSDLFAQCWEMSKESKNLLVLQSADRNQLEVLKTLRILTELGIEYKDLSFYKKRNPSEDLLFKLWKEMDYTLRKDISQLKDFLHHKGDLKETLTSALIQWATELFPEKTTSKTLEMRKNSNLLEESWFNDIKASLEKKTLILHGFYFITPIQELFFQRLEQEYNLVFLNVYDERYPETFSTVKAFLLNGETNVSKVVPDDVPIHPLAVRLIDSLEGETISTVEQKVTVYSDLSHFIDTEKRKLKELTQSQDQEENSYHLLTPRDKEVKKQFIANEFLPPDKKKLTDYPVGRFLYRLHQMKRRENNLDTGVVVYHEYVTAEALLDCFSSGCLIVNGEDMREYVKSLEKILPYCKNADTFHGWEEKINKLMAVKKTWENSVLKGNSQALADRLHKFHSSPIRQLSYFSVPKKELDKIKAGIQSLKGINDTLFGEWTSKKVDITTHLNQLDRHVLRTVEDYMADDEKKVVKNLIREISKLKDDELEFTLRDISQGLLFYLDGTLKDLETQDSATEEMMAFEHADGAPFYSIRKFHLAFADHKALPIPQGYSMWPLSRGMMEHFQETVPELGLLEKRKEHTNAITRYLLYVLFHSADDIRFSYVKSIGKESRLELSLYLQMLGFETKSAKRVTQELTGIVKEPPQLLMDVNTAGWTYSMEREAKICGKRAAFSYILNEHPSFSSDFHHGFLYSNMMEFFNHLVDDPSRNWKEVNNWFPQWHDMKLNFLYASKLSDRKVKTPENKVDDRLYSQAINYLHLLPNGYSSLNPDIVNSGISGLPIARNGANCKYCPHLPICVDGIYSIDEEEERKGSGGSSKSYDRKIVEAIQSTVSVEIPSQEINFNISGFRYYKEDAYSIVDRLRNTPEVTLQLELDGGGTKRLFVYWKKKRIAVVSVKDMRNAIPYISKKLLITNANKLDPKYFAKREQITKDRKALFLKAFLKVEI
ncbi:hypothetical protein [Rossellomorea vietnamensis]|uniref:hypothetical protein n=1 Tax=Rossellomorea vietnamensis TaxID=218284 RepID=UPI003D27CECF